MCDTCQDCSGDNITLPVAIGATGAAGPAGADGADGQAGSVVLFNNMTAATTASNVVGDLTGMTYTLPLAQLATNGSKLKLNAYFTLTGGATLAGANIEVHFAGVTISTVPSLFDLNRNMDMLKLEVVFMRKSDTLVYAECLKREGVLQNGRLSGSDQTQYLETNIVANDLDTLTNIIKLRGNVYDVTNTLNCQYMSIEFLNKI